MICSRCGGFMSLIHKADIKAEIQADGVKVGNQEHTTVWRCDDCSFEDGPRSLEDDDE